MLATTSRLLKTLRNTLCCDSEAPLREAVDAALSVWKNPADQRWIALYRQLENVGSKGIELIDDYLTELALDPLTATQFWIAFNKSQYFPHIQLRRRGLEGREASKAEFQQYFEIEQQEKQITSEQLISYFKHGQQSRQSNTSIFGPVLPVLVSNKTDTQDLNNSNKVQHYCIHLIEAPWHDKFGKILDLFMRVREKSLLDSGVINEFFCHIFQKKNYIAFNKLLDTLLAIYQPEICDPSPAIVIASLNVGRMQCLLRAVIDQACDINNDFSLKDRRFLEIFLEKILPGTEQHIDQFLHYMKTNHNPMYVPTVIEWLQDLQKKKEDVDVSRQESQKWRR